MEIKVDYADSLELERLQYELLSRVNILVFLIQINSADKINQFNKYHKEYINFYKQYEEAKNKLEKKYIKDLLLKKTKWELDFNTQILTIKV